MDILKSAESVNINPEPASLSPSSLGHIALFIGGFEGTLKDQFIELNKDHIWTPPSRGKVLQTDDGSVDDEQPEPWRGDVRGDITLDGPILCHSFLSPPIRSYGWHHGAESDTSKSTLKKPRDILYPLNAKSGISSSAFRIDYTADANHKYIPRLTPLVLKSFIGIQIGTLNLKRTFNDKVDLTEPAKIRLPGLSFWMWKPRLNEDEQEVFTANVSAFIHRANCLDEGFFPGMASTSDATLGPTPSLALPYETPETYEKRERRTGLSLAVYERRELLSKGGFRKVYLVKVIRRPEPEGANLRPHTQIPQSNNHYEPPCPPTKKRKLVAKEVFQEGDGSESAKQFYRNMMEREYSIITNNPHPHVNTIIDIAYNLGTDANPWLIEELMPHCLATFLRDGESPPFPLDAEDTMRQLLSVLIHYDDSGIIHTDIKPENVLMELVEDVGGERSRWHFKMSDHNTSRLTSRSVEGLAGTPFYCAPEVLDKKPYGKRVDIFSLGILFVDLLVGHSLCRDQPFGGRHPQSSSELAVWMNLVGVFIDRFCDPKHHPLLKNMLMRDPLKRWRPAQCLAFLNDPSQTNDRIVSVPPALPWTSSPFTEKQLRGVRKRRHYHLERNDIEYDDPAVGPGQQLNDADSDETILEPRVAQLLNNPDGPRANTAQFRDEDADEDEDQDDKDNDIVNLSVHVNESLNRFPGTETSERGSYVTALEFQVEDDRPVTSKPSYATQMPVTPCPGTPRDELLSVPCTPADDDCATYPAARRRADEPEFYDFSNSEWDWELDNSDDMNKFIELYMQITSPSQPSSQKKVKMTKYGLALLENRSVKLGNRHLSLPTSRKARNRGAIRPPKHELARNTMIMQPIGIFNHQLPGPTTSRRAMKPTDSPLEHNGDNHLDSPKRPRPNPELEHENMATPRPSRPTSPEGVPQSTAPDSPSAADSEAETVIEDGEDQQPEALSDGGNGANTEAPPAISPAYEGIASSANPIVPASQRTGNYRRAPADASTRRTKALYSMTHSSLGIGMGTIR
ncbi:kinase-like domain-containing protein [Trichoderma chlorosporum]